MGMFDVVWVKCPNCGASVRFQSKAGPRIMATYELDSTPSVVLGDMHGREETCKTCDSTITIKVIMTPVVEIKRC